MVPEGSFQMPSQATRLAACWKWTRRYTVGTFLLACASRCGAPMPASRRSSMRSTSSMRCGRTRSFIRLNLLSLAFTDRRHRRAAADGERGGGVSAGAQSRIGPDTEAGHPWPGPLASCCSRSCCALGRALPVWPSRPAARWEWLSAGTVAAALLWIAGSAALSWYLSNFGDYSATYGSLGAAIGLMMWMWMSAIGRAVRRRTQLGNRAPDRRTPRSAHGRSTWVAGYSRRAPPPEAEATGSGESKNI